MALQTYTELKDAIVDYSIELSPADPLALFITLAEREFLPLIRHYRGERTVEITTTSNVCELPADFLDARVVRVDGQLAKPVSAYGATLDAGQVGYFQSGNTIVFVPQHSASHQVELTYYAEPEALSDTNATNWVLEKFPAVYLHGAVTQGFIWRDNAEREAMERGRFQQALGLVSENHLRAARGGNQIIDGGFSYGD